MEASQKKETKPDPSTPSAEAWPYIDSIAKTQGGKSTDAPWLARWAGQGAEKKGEKGQGTDVVSEREH